MDLSTVGTPIVPELLSTQDLPSIPGSVKIFGDPSPLYMRMELATVDHPVYEIKLYRNFSGVGIIVKLSKDDQRVRTLVFAEMELLQALVTLAVDHFEHDDSKIDTGD